MNSAVRQVVNAARRWARERERCRRVCDSKTSSADDISSAKHRFSETAQTLSEAVTAFEKALKQLPKKSRLDWRKVFKAVEVGAKVIEGVVSAGQAEAIRSGVIDTTGEEV